MLSLSYAFPQQQQQQQQQQKHPQSCQKALCLRILHALISVKSVSFLIILLYKFFMQSSF